MKRTLGVCALLALASLSGACGFKIFEDIGSDPHPPTVEITALVHFVEAVETTTPAALNADRAVSPAPRTVHRLGLRGVHREPRTEIPDRDRAYTDAGGDIESFQLHDRDNNANDASLVPTDQTFYTGTAGTVLGPEDGLELTGIAGPHRMELWAEDSHGSRSEKVEFVITLVL